MARITPETARLLADELIRAGRARVSDRDSLIQRLLAQSEATGDAAPEGAIASAMMIPQPRTVTPATPAPMQPGVPLVAPKPVAEAPVEAVEQPVQQRPAPRPSRYRPLLDGTLRDLSALEEDISQAQAAGQQVPVTDQARLRGLRQRASTLQQYVQAEEGAEIPEEAQAAIEGQQARLARREELLAEDKSRAPWEALLAGGAAMAQGRRGENFAEALTRGLQAGLQNYGQARRANIEGTESIGEARDQAILNRYNILEKARADAVAAVRSGQDVDEQTLRLASLNRKDMLEEATAPFVVGKAKSEASKAETEARYAPEEAQSTIRLRNAQSAYYRGEGRQTGGSGSKADVEGRADRDELDDAAAEYEGARAAYNAALRENGMKASMVPPELTNAMLSARAKLEARSRAFKRRYGSSPYIGAEPQRATPSKTAIPADPLGIRR